MQNMNKSIEPFSRKTANQLLTNYYRGDSMGPASRKSQVQYDQFHHPQVPRPFSFVTDGKSDDLNASPEIWVGKRFNFMGLLQLP